MIILITGASHTGKTLLAQKILEKYKSFGKDPEEVHFMFVLTANNFRPNKC